MLLSGGEICHGSDDAGFSRAERELRGVSRAEKVAAPPDKHPRKIARLE